MTTPPLDAEDAKYPARRPRGPWILFALACLVEAVFVGAMWSEAYIDFGDGNYLYIAGRIADGLVPYRDILAPQPPCHLFLGAALTLLARALGWATPLFLARAASLAMRLASAGLVASIARRAWGRDGVGALAGVIYLGLPIGLWWSMGWQSEPLEIFFLLIMARLALNGTPRADVLAGLAGGMAALTNATAAPFLIALLVYMLASNPRRAVRLAVPAAVLGGVVTAGLEIWTGGAFLNNVVFNQVGSYPSPFLPYAMFKILREGRDIFWLDGFWIVAAAAGLVRFARLSPLEPATRNALGCFFAATLFSFLYVTKGGTVDYIFCLGEPAVAILAAGELAAAARALRNHGTERDSMEAASGAVAPDERGEPGDRGERGSRGAALIIRAGLAFAALPALGPAVSQYRQLWTQAAFELPDLPPDRIIGSEGAPLPNVGQVKSWIDRHSRPGDAILAPPFYAFLTGRRLAGEYSEIFIWTINDRNDRVAGNPDGEGWSKTRELAGMIDRAELPLVIIELDQTGRLPEIMAALKKRYRMILPEPYRTLNTRLGVYVPNDSAEPAAPGAAPPREADATPTN